MRRILLDRTNLRGHVTGIERIALDLFDPAHLAPHAVRPVTAGGLPGMIAAQQIGLPLRLLGDRGSLLLLPGFPPGLLCALAAERCVLYVHDTFLLTRTHDLSWKSRLYMTPGFRFAMRWARTILVNSLTTGHAVRSLCRPDALVAPLRPAVRDVFGLAGLPGPATYRPGEPLRMLAIGTIEPRKDYPAALALTAALNRSGMPAELHVVGRVGWGRHPFLDAPPPFLRLHGYVDDGALRRLAASSHLLLSTSKAEGLGLPLLEVQHGGLPVVAPDDAVFREVLGGSGLLVRPHEPEGSAAALRGWVEAGGLPRASSAGRANLAAWNARAAADGVRFRAFLDIGLAAYDGSDLDPGTAIRK